MATLALPYGLGLALPSPLSARHPRLPKQRLSHAILNFAPWLPPYCVTMLPMNYFPLLFDHQFLALLAKQSATLVALVDPFLLIPLFLKITEGQSSRDRAIFTRSVGLMVGACLLGAAIAGPAIFSYFELSLSALQIAGGFVLFTMGIAMLLGQELQAKGHGSEPDQDKAHIVPLAIPLLAGPASISYVMTAQSSSGGYATAGACIVAALVVWIAFSFAEKIGSRMTASHIAIVERLAGLLVTVMAIEALGHGLKGMFPILSGSP
jgi:multiple antibiotic resistance protein